MNLLNGMKKVPAGTFIIPMIISAALYTLFPGYSEIGGSTQWLLTADGTGFIVAAIVFFSGTLVKLQTLIEVLKKQGVLIVVKTIFAILGIWLYIQFFGYDGIFGVSILAVVLALSSINPSMYISLANGYGKQEDVAAFGLIGAFCLPFYPTLLYGVVGSSSSLDLMPVLSTLIPLFLGMLLGNLDDNFSKLYAPGISMLIPILGWNIGYGMNLLSAVQALPAGIVLAIIFYLFMSPMYLTERYVLRDNGITSLLMTSAAGLSVSYASVLAQTYPALEPYVQSAQVQVLTLVVITAVVTPILTGRRYHGIRPTDQGLQ